MGRNAIQDPDHVLTFDRLARSQCEAHPGPGVHDGQDAEASTVEEVVGHEVHGPAGIKPLGCGPGLSESSRFVPTWPLVPQGQACGLIEAIHPLVIHPPPLSAEQDRNPTVAIPDAHLGNLSDALEQGGLVRLAADIPVDAPLDAQSSAHGPLTVAKPVL